MIRIFSARAKAFSRVIVLGGGPSAGDFLPPLWLTKDTLVIGTNNHPALKACADLKLGSTLVSLACDYPHVRDTTLPEGVNGIYVPADGGPPVGLGPPSYRFWIPRAGRTHWEHGMTSDLQFGLYLGGGAGAAALALGLHQARCTLIAYGFDGRGVYDTTRPGVDYIMNLARLRSGLEESFAFLDRSRSVHPPWYT